MTTLAALLLLYGVAFFLGFTVLGVFLQRWVDVRLKPEISRFPSRREAREVLRRNRTRLVRLVFLIALAIGLCLTLAVMGFGSLLRRLGPISVFTLTAILLVPGVVLLAWSDFRWSQRALRQALNERGKPTCITCGYDLRGLTPDPPDGATVCPECGTRTEQMPQKRDESLSSG